MKFLKNKITPRLYQEKIFHKCVKKNCLVVLPTGLGKTIIGLMLSAYRLRRVKNSKILFLAPTKPLIMQHHNTFSKFFEHEDEELLVVSGEVSPEDREKLYNDAVIIFSTPQTIENDIITRSFSLKNVSLIIFDECHRGVGNYAYTFISDVYEKQGDNKMTLGLSASPGSNSEKIREVCKNLNFKNIVYKDEKSRDVKPYVKKKKINKVVVTLPDSLERIKKGLEVSFKKRLKVMKKNGLLNTSSINKVSKKDLLRIQGMLQKKISSAERTPELFDNISLVAEALKISYALELLQTQGVKQLISYFNSIKKKLRVKANRSLLKDEDFRESMREVYEIEDSVEHPKFEKLSEIVNNDIKDKKFIVFTNYRNTAKRVVEYLKENTDAKPVLFIGQSGSEGLSQKEQIRVLKKFSKGVYNVLASTSVGEEGLHVPSVDYAVFFEPVPSGLRMIQRKGRVGRTKIGNVIVMYTKGCIDEKYYYVSKYKEKKMKKAINDLKEEMNNDQKKLGEF